MNVEPAGSHEIVPDFVEFAELAAITAIWFMNILTPDK
jgi:branched-subunit amino acid transport protein